MGVPSIGYTCQSVDYLVLAVSNLYKGSNDFEKIWSLDEISGKSQDDLSEFEDLADEINF